MDAILNLLFHFCCNVFSASTMTSWEC